MRWEHLPLTKITDDRGKLTFISSGLHLPFNIARVYYIYDVSPGAMRAGHAHWQLEQLFIAVSGSFNIRLDDGLHKETITLDRPYHGLYVKSMVWREIDNFSPGSVCLVLASLGYDEADYIRDYKDFQAALEKQRATHMLTERQR